MSQCNTTFDLKINLGHMVTWSSDFYLLLFALKNILVLLAKPDSGGFIGKARFRRATLSCDSSYYCVLSIIMSYSSQNRL